MSKCVVCGKEYDSKDGLPWCSGNCEWVDIFFTEEGLEVIEPKS